MPASLALIAGLLVGILLGILDRNLLRRKLAKRQQLDVERIYRDGYHHGFGAGLHHRDNQDAGQSPAEPPMPI